MDDHLIPLLLSRTPRPEPKHLRERHHRERDEDRRQLTRSADRNAFRPRAGGCCRRLPGLSNSPSLARPRLSHPDPHPQPLEIPPAAAAAHPCPRAGEGNVQIVHPYGPDKLPGAIPIIPGVRCRGHDRLVAKIESTENRR